ncbi:MAG: hypothetical protein WC154_00295 [Candidatus Izemoplasmatales bacterium]
MAIIRVKRGTSKPSTSNLGNIGELAFDYSNNVLYARNTTSVVKIGGELEQVYFYQGYGYSRTITYPFSSDYIYKVHIISTTKGTSTDTSDTYIYYKTSSGSSLYGSYINHHLNTQDSTHTRRVGTNSTVRYIEDSYVAGAALTSGITKVIDFELSPTFHSTYLDTQTWVAYGKAVTTTSNQNDGSIKMVDFMHTAKGSLGQLYINTGLNIGSPDSISITIYRVKRR